tara:strand:+ start:711 stop:1262 length:552 start_codon:yes stop_codon:yes gene_type:complete
MKFIHTKIKDLLILEPTVYGDKRGYFFESFNKNKFEKKLGDISFIQDNESKSTMGVLRGLHFQKPPFDQAKLVRCIQGKVLDVAVDIRKGSKTFLKFLTVELSEENKKQLFIPRGFAHGFIVLSDLAVFAYKVDNIYAPKYDAGIKWDDKELNIDWRIDQSQVLVSEKDSNLPYLTDFKSPFN